MHLPSPVASPVSLVVPAASPTRPATTETTTKCIQWKEAAAHMNEMTCVRGTVYSTYKSGNTFFIDFDGSRTSFYGVSFKSTWDGLKGQCIELTGKISPYNGRPQIIIESRDQLTLCKQ
jgi:DNA/RNA endonuclease YhcR with UshA esterase domain